MRIGKDNLTRLSGKERLGQHRDSEYLGAEDIFPDDAEPILTIEGLYYGTTTTQKGKENHDVLAFRERSVTGIDVVRPLIVNSTNRKTLRKMFGSATAENLEGKQIQLYKDKNVRNPEDGGKTEGIRIRPHAPRPQPVFKPVICADCKQPITAMDDAHPAQWVASYTQKRYGVPVCMECGKKRKAAAEAAAAEEAEDGNSES